jgi:aspartate kinase
LRPKFRELHGLLIDLEEGRILTPDLKDQILSFGERLSSEIVAAAFERKGTYVTHINACDEVVTDDAFTKATPLHWEAYAKLRRNGALAARNSVVVMGGFIGANTRGQVTTLGRAARISPLLWRSPGSPRMRFKSGPTSMAFLSCDPRVLHGGYRLRSRDYDEALEVARLGAKVLHSQAAAPAVRQGIPIVNRNSRHPDLEGTLIGLSAMHTNGVVKSIDCLTNVAVVVHLSLQETGSPAKSL